MQKFSLNENIQEYKQNGWNTYNEWMTKIAVMDRLRAQRYLGHLQKRRTRRNWELFLV
jgi:hypothetical protein